MRIERAPGRRARSHGAGDLPYAEAWRRLAPVARSAGVRPPTYHTARWLIETLRTLRDDAAKLPAGADLLADLLTGRVPWRWLDRTLAGEWR